MSVFLVYNEFFVDKSDDFGFCHWRKKEFFPPGIYENSPSKLNYFSLNPKKYKEAVSPFFTFQKKRYNTYLISLPYSTTDSFIIDELKITNINLSDWQELWQNEKGEIIDLKIEKLNFSHNSLLDFSILERKPSLKELNLSFNTKLVYLNVSNSENLGKLDLSYCSSIEYINIAGSKEIKWISLKNCNASEDCQESLLRNMRPIRKGFLDLTGNSINWGNRNIASKIRLLLANEWNILWDSNPPDSIIPLGYGKKFDPFLLDRNFKL